MDFHALNDKGTVHVMTTHRAQDDETPLQLISVQRLQQLLALEQPPAEGSPCPVCNPDCSTPPA